MTVTANAELMFRPVTDLAGLVRRGEISAREWTTLLSPETLEGTPFEFEARPTGIALLERRPAHDRFRITGFDGRPRVISVTTLPLSLAGLGAYLVLERSRPGALEAR